MLKLWYERGHLKKYYRAPKKKGDEQQETTQEANVAGDVLQDSLILRVGKQKKSEKLDLVHTDVCGPAQV